MFAESEKLQLYPPCVMTNGLGWHKQEECFSFALSYSLEEGCHNMGLVKLWVCLVQFIMLVLTHPKKITSKKRRSHRTSQSLCSLALTTAARLMASLRNLLWLVCSVVTLFHHAQSDLWCEFSHSFTIKRSPTAGAMPAYFLKPIFPSLFELLYFGIVGSVKIIRNLLLIKR